MSFSWTTAAAPGVWRVLKTETTTPSSEWELKSLTERKHVCHGSILNLLPPLHREMCATHNWSITFSTRNGSTPSFTSPPKHTLVRGWTKTTFGRWCSCRLVSFSVFISTRIVLPVPFQLPVRQCGWNQGAAGSCPPGPTSASTLHLREHRWGVWGQRGPGEAGREDLSHRLVDLNRWIYRLFLLRRSLMRAARWGRPILILLLKQLQSCWSLPTGMRTR